MSVAPRIPGMDAFPELQKKYERHYREALRQKTGCGGCGTSKVLRSFKAQLEQRQQRDK
jgi:formate dehydrogenase assembly factor FdhD